MEQEGVIKYRQNWNQSADFPAYDISSLIEYRRKCFARHWIGFDKKYEVGFGNISLKYQNNKQFFISGSQTGHIPELDATHFSFISHFDIPKNTIDCIGLTKASSESLTHAAIYELSDKVLAVIHIHSKALWEKYIHRLPTTNPKVEYGTPEMAQEVQRLFDNDEITDTDVLIMGGHEDGIIAWGENFEVAFRLLEKL